MATTINPCVYHNIINSASSLLVRWQSFYSCSFHMQVAPWRKPHRSMSNFMRRRYMRPGMMQHSIFASTSASPSEQMVINYYRVGNLSFGDRRASIIFIVNAPQTAVCVFANQNENGFSVSFIFFYSLALVDATSHQHCRQIIVSVGILMHR